MLHEPKMAEIASELKSRAYEVDKPNIVEGHVYTDNLDANADLKRGFIDEHFAKVDTSEAVLVVNEDKNGIKNYIGGNTLIEIAYAYSQGLDIFLLNPVPEIGYADEINGMHPIILNGDISKIDTYVNSLPQLHMRTTSHPKQLAVSRAMRRAGIPVRVDGAKFPSGVSEQPMTMQETYEGAINRHQAMLQAVSKANYFCTIESGFESIHDERNLYGCSVVVFQEAGKDIKIGAELNLEFPKEIFDEVPSKYADVGVLIQQKYKSVHKDAYPFLTDGKLTRREILENAVFNLIVSKKDMAQL